MIRWMERLAAPALALPSAPMGWWQTLPFGARGFAVGAELVQQPGQVFCWRAGRGKAWIASFLAMSGS